MTRRNHRRSAARERRWRRLLAEQRRSGQSIRAFCKGHGLAEPNFYAWRREIGLRDREAVLGRFGVGSGSNGRRGLWDDGRRHASFAAVHIVPPGPSKGPMDAAPRPGVAEGDIEILLAEGRRLRVGSAFDAGALRRVLAALEGGPC